MTQATVFVRFQHAGFHHWPAAPIKHAYLASRHRHLFHVEVSMPSLVNGYRSVEFHELLDESKKAISDISEYGTSNYGEMSCEEMAYETAQRLSWLYGREVTVTVSEDGECGATVCTRTAIQKSGQS